LQALAITTTVGLRFSVTVCYGKNEKRQLR